MTPLHDLKNLRRLRRLAGLTQKDLANAVGVSQSYIAKLERGRLQPPYEKAKQIFDRLEAALARGRKPLKAGEIHTENPVCVEKEETVEVAVRRMTQGGYSQLPVVDNGKYVGCVTERTILQVLASASGEERVYDLPVVAIMGEPFPVVDVSTPAEVLIPLIRHSQAILTAREGLVVGIITPADLLRLGERKND